MGLAISLAGVAYLAWALVAGVSRSLMQEMIQNVGKAALEPSTRLVKVFFVEGGFVIDLVGLTWLTGSMVLVLLSSRQRIGISWAWFCATLQSVTAALGGAVVAWAVQRPYVAILSHAAGSSHLNAPAQISMISLPIVMSAAVVLWVTFLVWLLVERARLNRFGPTLSDGMRTNIYR